MNCQDVNCNKIFHSMELKRKDYLFVGLQFLLFLLYFLDIEIITFEIPYWLEIFCIFTSILRLIVLVLGMLQLNDNLSPFPSPKSNSELVQTGLYKFIRHPIYTGILIAFLAFGFYSTSLFRILITLILYILFHFKSKFEEEQLRERYPEYANYQKETGRFFPVLFPKND